MKTKTVLDNQKSLLDDDFNKKIKIQIGANIKKLRKEKRLTQREVANKMGVVINSVTRIEKGTNFISIQSLKKLCMVLECNSIQILNF
jgi:transcriptional regulator with XRE-family HTH domain